MKKKLSICSEMFFPIFLSSNTSLVMACDESRLFVLACSISDRQLHLLTWNIAEELFDPAGQVVDNWSILVLVVNTCSGQ